MSVTDQYYGYTHRKKGTETVPLALGCYCYKQHPFFQRGFCRIWKNLKYYYVQERVTSDDSNGDLMKQFHTGTYDFSPSKYR